MSLTEHYAGYGWIKVKRAKAFFATECQGDVADVGEPVKVVSEEHHIEETTFLIEEVRRLAKEIDDLKKPKE